MYSKIYNPITQGVINIDSRQGMIVLQNYINQNGGFGSGNNSLDLSVFSDLFVTEKVNPMVGPFSSSSGFSILDSDDDEDYDNDSIVLNKSDEDEIILGEMRPYDSSNNSKVLDENILVPNTGLGYFEFQYLNFCGGHALNHLLGYKKFLNSKKLHTYEQNNTNTTGFYTLELDDDNSGDYIATISNIGISKGDLWNISPDIKINLYSEKIINLFDTHLSSYHSQGKDSSNIVAYSQARMSPVTFQSFGSGDYTAQYLIYILQKLGYTAFNTSQSAKDKIFLRDKTAIGLIQDTYIGTLLNVNGSHWVAIKKLDSSYIYIDSVHFKKPEYLDLNVALDKILASNIQGIIEVHQGTKYNQRHFIPQDNSFASWNIKGIKFYYQNVFKIQDITETKNLVTHQQLLQDSKEMKFELPSGTHIFNVKDFTFSGNVERVYYTPLSDSEIEQATAFSKFLSDNAKEETITHRYQNLGTTSKHLNNDSNQKWSLEYDIPKLALKKAIRDIKIPSKINLETIIATAKKNMGITINIVKLICANCEEQFERPSLDLEGKSPLEANKCTYLTQGTKNKTPCCYHCRPKKNPTNKPKINKVREMLISISKIDNMSYDEQVNEEFENTRKSISNILDIWKKYIRYKGGNVEGESIKSVIGNRFIEIFKEELDKLIIPAPEVHSILGKRQ